jgi:hypothetical protein
MKLNLTNCIFWVPAGKLLGYIVSELGIEENSDKIAAITKHGKAKDLQGVCSDSLVRCSLKSIHISTR